MKIEQTNAVKIDVEHFAKIAKENQYIIGREQTAAEALQRIIKIPWRGIRPKNRGKSQSESTL